MIQSDSIVTGEGMAGWRACHDTNDCIVIGSGLKG